MPSVWSTIMTIVDKILCWMNKTLLYYTWSNALKLVIFKCLLIIKVLLPRTNYLMLKMSYSAFGVYSSNRIVSKYKIIFYCKSFCLDLGFLSSSLAKTVFKTTYLFTITKFTKERALWTIPYTLKLCPPTPMITFAWPGWKFHSSVTEALTNFTCRIEHDLGIKSIQLFKE